MGRERSQEKISKMRFYACPMCCNKGFTSQQDLKEHLAKANASMKCPACSKSFKNLLYLIKHLDQCNVGDVDSRSPTKDFTGFSGSSINMDLNSDNEDDDDDDVDGYFCTVCDIKIPEVEEHVRKFHSGQEVILQDDDDDEETEIIAPSEVQYHCPDRSDDHKNSPKRKHYELLNGTDTKEKKSKLTSHVKEKEETESNEIFYCPKCDMNFHSLSDHTANYHKNTDLLVKDISILELFASSRQSNGTFAYHCSGCQKNIVRKKTLVKHLKLFDTDGKTAKPSKHHNNCKKSNKSFSSSSLDDSSLIKSEIDEQAESEDVYKFDEVKQESDMYDFDELGHSIFNT